MLEDPPANRCNHWTDGSPSSISNHSQLQADFFKPNRWLNSFYLSTITEKNVFSATKKKILILLFKINSFLMMKIFTEENYLFGLLDYHFYKNLISNHLCYSCQWLLKFYFKSNNWIPTRKILKHISKNLLKTPQLYIFIF